MKNSELMTRKNYLLVCASPCMKNGAKEDLNAAMVLGSVQSTVNVSNIFECNKHKISFLHSCKEIE